MYNLICTRQLSKFVKVHLFKFKTVLPRTVLLLRRMFPLAFHRPALPVGVSFFYFSTHCEPHGNFQEEEWLGVRVKPIGGLW